MKELETTDTGEYGRAMDAFLAKEDLRGAMDAQPATKAEDLKEGQAGPLTKVQTRIGEQVAALKQPHTESDIRKAGIKYTKPGAPVR